MVNISTNATYGVVNIVPDMDRHKMWRYWYG